MLRVGLITRTRCLANSPRSCFRTRTITIRTMPTVTVHLDRDSVAAGDDTDSHAYTTFVPVGTLREVLERVTPEIRQSGWSFVAHVSSPPSAPAVRAAVWSVDGGVDMLPTSAAIQIGVADVRVYWVYFLQMDPQWLQVQLSRDVTLTIDALAVMYRQQTKS